MRYVFSVAAMAVLSFFAPVQASAQGLSVTNYRLISTERVNSTQYYHTLAADLVNTGAARSVVTATVSSPVANLQVVAGQQNLHFSPVPAGSQVASLDTFRILVDTNFPVNYSQLQWTFTAPYANAGPNQTVPVGGTVTLNGSGSSNPAGGGYLLYNWTFLSRPPGSSARISNSSEPIASFVADVVNSSWLVQLTVTNSAGTDVSVMTVTTGNSAPVANAGPNQTVIPGALVTLNGSASSDADGDSLTYAWTLTARPAGSAAVLSNPASVMPTFTADRTGTYTAQLIVNDGHGHNSVASIVTITTQNTAPVANAGNAQSVSLNQVVQLNGAGSTDVDGDPLTYAWTLISKPSGSAASLTSANTVTSSFTVDLAGTYVAQLIVNDGKVNSLPATVTITTGGPLVPTANAGPNQTVKHHSLVQLNGSGTDPQSLPLTYLWSLATKPAGSSAVLSSTNASNPTFTADLPGNYVAQLIVNNGQQSSQPSTVTITTTNTAPVANAGSNQTAALNSVVTLNGSFSSDADGDALTFAWTFSSRPAGSTATLQAASSSSPTFIPDIAGTYVIQLIVSDAFASSVPATVTVTSSSTSITLSPDPLTLAVNSPGTMTLTLSSAAPAGGLVVNLTNFTPSVASVPATVTVPGNAFLVNFSVTPLTSGTAQITASAPGYRPGTAVVNVGTPTISISLSNSTVGLTKTVNGTVTLSGPAPVPGVSVNLNAAPAGVVTVSPSPVFIAAGNTSGSFTVTGVSAGSAQITGSAPGYSSGSAPINAALLGQVSVERNVTVGLGATKAIQVSLASPAPVGGLVVTLSSSNPAAVTVTSTITIPGGSTVPSSPAMITGVAFGNSTISASASGFTGDSALVVVGSALTFNPGALSMGAGSVQNLSLTLSSAATSALTVNLASSNPAVATVPASVVIAQNATSVLVPVTSVSAGTSTITATPAIPNIVAATANITVANLGGIQMPSTNTVGLGQTVSLQISLSAVAPAGGVTINLASSNSALASLSTTSVFIAANATTPAVQPIITGAAPGSALITATANGFATATQGVSVTAAFSLNPSTLAFPSGSTQNLTLSLSAPAPVGGLTATISSNNTGVATVPATVSFAAGATTAQVPVAGQVPGTAVITAAATGVTSATSNITIQNSGVILVSSATLSPGQSAPLTVKLPAPAAVNTTITLTSSDPSKATLSPATVTVLAGQTQPTVAPSVNGIAFGNATISATATGFGPGSGIATIGATMSFAQSNVTINAGSSQSLQLSLSVTAPAGGVPVTLSSSNGSVLLMPSGVNLAQNSGGVNFLITGLNPGTTVITASTTTPNITPATITVTVPGAAGSGSISLPVGTSVQVGQSANFPVTLSVAAPAGGVVVALASGDTSKVTISPASVTIAAGQTTPAVQPQVTGVAAGSASITASASGYTGASQSVTVTSAGTVTLTPSTQSIVVGSTQNLTVTLPSAAGAGGQTVTLTSSNTAVATVPASVLVSQGATTAQVPVTSLTTGTTTITAASAGQGQATSAITVTAAIGINLPSNFIVGPGQNNKTYTVTLANPAAVATTVTLAVSDTSKMTISPQTIFFNAGQTTPTSQPTVNGIAEGNVTVTASGAGLTTATGNAKVGYTLAFNPATLSIAGTSTQNLSLTISSAPPTNLTVNLSSGNTAAATVNSTVVIAAGSTSANVPVTGVAPGTAVITASTASISATTATVTVAASNSIIVPALTPLALGKTVAIPVTLSTPAPAGGVTVTVTSPDTLKVIVQTPTVFIAAGQTQPASQPVVLGENVGDVAVSFTAPGYTAGSAVISVGTTIYWTTPNVQMSVGESKIVFLPIAASAPGIPPFPGDTGVKINFVSSNPNVVYSRSDVTAYPDGSEFTTIALQITGIGAGVATITASGINIPAVVMTVTVLGPGGSSGLISLPSGTSVTAGQSANFPVTLSTPAPVGGLIVSLSSGDTSKVTISPSSVTIAAGQTTPAVQPQVTGVAAGSASITAAATGYTGASQSVTVTSAGTVTLTPPSQSIVIGTTQNLTVTLPTAAGAGGKTVTLSSSNTGVATVPASVLVAQGATTAQVPVTAVSTGTANITAASTGQGQATSAITVTSAIGINLPANFIVGPGQNNKTYTVTLASPAAAATTVTLAVSDDSKMTISPQTIFFNAGQTTPTSQPTVNGIAEGNVTVTASGAGLTTATGNAKVGYTLAFSPATLSIAGTTTQNLNLTLSSATPTNLTVNLSSGNTAAATVNSSVIIAAGSASANVPVTGVAPGTAVITASTASIAATTATVTVSGTNAIQVPAVTSVSLGKTVALPITLSTPAPVGGVTVTVTSPDTLKVIVQTPTVFIAGGQTQPASQPTVLGENVGDVAVSFTAPGYTSGSAVVSVGTTIYWTTPNVELALGQSKIVFLPIAASAPGIPPFPGDTGVKINFVSSNPNIVYSRSDVTAYPDGSEFTTIALQITAIGTGVATITASGINIPPVVMTVTVGGPLTITTATLPAGTVGVPYSQTLLGAGGTSPRSWSLISGTLPTGLALDGNTGIISGNPSVAVTNTPLTFRLTDSASPAASVNVQLTLTINPNGGGGGNGTMTLTPSPLAITGTATQNLTLTLSAAAPVGGLPVNLSSSNPAAATVPASVTVSAGNTTATVPVTGVATGTSTVTAQASNFNQATATVNVSSASGDIILPQNLVIAPGDFKTFPVTLSAPASQSTFVTLTISDPSKASLSTQNIIINAGQTTPSLQPRLNGIATGNITVTATAGGLASATTSARIGYALAFAPTSVSLTGTGSQNATLTLSSSMASNLPVTLTSSNPNVATVPSSLNFAVGNTSANVQITGVTPGTATITASAVGVPDATMTVTVIAPNAVLIQAVSLPVGETIAIPITISNPAPAGGVAVTLTSSNPSSVTLPATVIIPAGQTAPAAPVMVSGVNIGSSTITGSVSGFAAGSATVNVTAAVSWQSPAPTLSAGSQQTLTLRLAAQATIPGGVTVNLTSSNPGVATVPPTVTFFPDGNPFVNVTVNVTGVAAGTAVITAQAFNIPAATLTATVIPAVAVSTTTLPNGSFGLLYNQTLAATGGVGPFTWEATGGHLPAGLSVTSAGVVTGTPTESATGAQFTVQVTDSSNPPRTATGTITITITGQTPSSLTVSGLASQTTLVNTPFGNSLAVLVKDANDLPVAGITVTFSAPGSGASATFAGGVVTAITGANGIANSALPSANLVPGSYDVTASVNGVGGTATFRLTNLPGAPASVAVVSGNLQNTPTSTAFPAVLVARVTDQFGNPVNGATVTFTAPGVGLPGGAFAGGNTAVSDPNGLATTTIFTANASHGTYSVVASTPGAATSATFSLTNTSGPISSVTTVSGTPQLAFINSNYTLPFGVVVKDQGGFTVPGVTVTFAAPGSGASGSFAGAVTTAVTNAVGVANSAVFAANGAAGSYVVSASVAGVATTADFALTNRLPPASITVLSGTPQSVITGYTFSAPLKVLVKDALDAPVSGVTVTFALPASGASATFVGGVTTAVTNASGVATSPLLVANGSAGGYSATATVSGLPAVNFALTNTALVNNGPAITLPTVTVGKDLQQIITVTIPSPAPAGGKHVFLSSTDYNLVRIAGRPADAGLAQPLDILILEGLTQATGIYVQGLASSGAAQIVATSAGLTDGVADVLLTPSGFVLSGPTGTAGSYTMSLGGTATLTVLPARLDANQNLAAVQSLRGGTSVAISMTSSVAGIGVLNPVTVNIGPGESSATTAFFANGVTGATNVTAVVPSGFSQPSLGANSLAITVVPSGMSAENVTVGKNLQTSTRLSLNSPVPGVLGDFVRITITSADPSKLIFSKTEGGLGSGSIDLDVPAGRVNSQFFYVQGLGNSGTVEYLATGNGYGSASGIVTLTPSGFVIFSPTGRGTNFNTTTGAENSNLTITAARLDNSLNFVETQNVRGGISVDVPVVSSNTSVGVITASPVTILGGPNGSGTTQFDPLVAGTTQISATAPSGFSTPSPGGAVLAQVITPAMNVSAVTVGKDLQGQATLFLGQAAGAGGLDVVLTSNSPDLLLSGSATVAGSNQITIHLNQGQSSALIITQGLTDTGTATYSVQASGYNSVNGTVTFAKSGVVIGSGQPGQQMTVFYPTKGNVTVSTAILNASNAFVTTQALRAGLTAVVPVANTNPSVGTLPGPTATIVGGLSDATLEFTPLTSGSTTMSVTQPSGFTTPTNNTSISGLVFVF